MAPQHQAAGGVLVESMRQRRGARQAVAQMDKGLFEVLAALGAAMHGKARRLVHHQNQAVAIEHARENLFRRHAGQAIEGARGCFAFVVMNAYRKIPKS